MENIVNVCYYLINDCLDSRYDMQNIVNVCYYLINVIVVYLNFSRKIQNRT